MANGFASPSISLPSVGTSFATSESKALVPYSPSGIGGIAKSMSPFESMREWFREMFMHLDELGADIISALTIHMEVMVAKFDGLQNTLLAISGITAKDLDIEKKSFKEDQENEAQKERDEALGDKRKGKDGDKRGWLDSLKDAFGRTKEAFAGGLGTKMKLLLLALGLVALTKYTEVILPKLKIVLARMKKIAGWFTKETGELDEDNKPIMELDWTKILGVGAALFVGKMIAGMAFRAAGGALLTGFKALAPHLVKGGALLGPAAVAAYGIYSAFQIAGDAAAAKDWTKEMGASDNETINKIAGGLGGKLEGGILNALKKASHWAGIGAMIGMVGGPPGMIIGGIIGGVIGGILGWIGGGKIAQAMDWVVDGFNGMWESVKTAISDVFYDREVADGPAGAVRTQRSLVGKLKDSLDNMIEGISNWIYDGKGVVFGMDFSGLSDLLPTLQEIADSIMNALPEWMHPKSQAEKQQAKQVEELEKMDFFDKDWVGKSEIDRSKINQASNEQLQALLALESDDLHQKDIDYIKAILTSRGVGERLTSRGVGEKKYNINETYVDNIIKEASAMKAKKDMLKTLTMAKDDTAPANITTLMNNPTVTNAVSNNHHMMAVANVDHSDAAVKHIIDIRHNR